MELKLKIHNSDDYMEIDPIDWEEARLVNWYLKGGKIVNRLGQTYEEFTGIGHKVHNMFGNHLDKRRDRLIDINMNYTYDEHGQCFVLKRNNEV